MKQVKSSCDCATGQFRLSAPHPGQRDDQSPQSRHRASGVDFPRTFLVLEFVWRLDQKS
jgi:hypothetical protein